MGSEGTEKIRVMLTITDLSIGGIEMFNLNLAKYLDKSRFEVTLVCWQGGGPLIDKLGKRDFSLVVFGLPPWNVVGIIWRYFREIRKRHIQILHASPGTLQRVVAKVLNVPVIISSFHSQWEFGLLKILRYRILSKFSDCLVGVSRSVAEHTKRKYRVKDGKIRNIYNGIFPKDFELTSKKNLLKEELDLGKDVYLIGYLGRLYHEKGADILIQSAPKVIQRIGDVHFIIVGDGPERVGLKRLTQDLGISKNVHFLGYRQDTPRILSALDIFTGPNRQAGFELVLAEAMSAGLPVVAFNVGAIPEVVVDEETGILVSPEDSEAFANAIIRLLGESRLRKKMGEAGRKRVEERFSVQKMAEEYGALYEELLAKKTGSTIS